MPIRAESIEDIKAIMRSGSTAIDTADRQAWEQARRDGVGASDMAILTGANRYEMRGAAYVYESKVEGVSIPYRNIMRIGHELEFMGLDLLEKECGIEFFHLGDMIFHRTEHRHHAASPDGLAVKPEVLAGAEIKCTTQRNASAWGTPGTNEVRNDVVVQTQWNMHVTDREVWFVGVLYRDNGAFDHYAVPRDQAFIDKLVVVADEFWSYVTRRVMPDRWQWGMPEFDRTRIRKTGGRVSWRGVATSLMSEMRELRAEQMQAAETMIRQFRGTEYEQQARGVWALAKQATRETEELIAKIVEEQTSR